MQKRVCGPKFRLISEKSIKKSLEPSYWKNNTVEEADESYNIDNISNSDYASSNGSSPQYPDKSGRNKVSDSTDPERVESSASYITPNELPVTDIYFKAKQSENKHAYRGRDKLARKKYT